MADSTGTVASPRSALRTKPSSLKSPQQSPRRALRLQLPVSDVGASDDSKQVCETHAHVCLHGINNLFHSAADTLDRAC